MAIATLRTLVDRMVRADSGVVTTDDRDAAIALAVAQYSKDRPRLAVEDVVVAGGRFVGLPAGLDPVAGALKGLECPIDADPVAMVEGWVEMAPSGWRIRLASALAAGAVVRVTYTGAHAVSDAEDTVPSADVEAVAVLAAATLFDGLAAQTSGDTDASIGAANVSRASPAQEYAARARKARERYQALVGVDPARLPPAGTVVSASSASGSQGWPRMFHGGAR